MFLAKGWFAVLLSPLCSAALWAASDPVPFDEHNPLFLAEIGSSDLRIISPSLLEVSLVTTKEPDPARVTEWDFVGENFALHLPSANSFKVVENGREIPVARVGFKRRALYAPLKKRDLRIGNWLYLELGRPLSDGQQVDVSNPDRKLWNDAERSFSARMESRRWNPAIHVNQVGYVPGFPKTAMVGYYLGSLGEMPLPTLAGSSQPSFKIIHSQSGQEVFSGMLRLRPDEGFTFPTYTRVWEADFTGLREPGEYQVLVPGLGVSFPFAIEDGVAAAFARAYALGLYHQRCGTSNALPFTRFTHGPCHTALAEIPTMQFKATQQLIADMSQDAKKEPRHTAPQLKSVDTSLYPFVRKGKIDVSGGHHDAGDYSKYTINSAALIHYLVFAADTFPGVAALDNLGIPESGDGRSDLLQEAKWEADFLAKMQDDDGGFYFLVYPKERAYEDDVLPDPGDPQVVWPKTTAVTAAATAALAQISASQTFRKQFPEAARLYFKKARKGWAFLERAIARFGRDGSYQKISHYGHEFLHDDELAWAAAEMFAATGNRGYEKELISRFDPTDRETKRWTWWRMFEGYGCAIRSYAFAASTGRLKANQLNTNFLSKCQSEIMAAGQDQLRFARECAYGSSFPDPNKRFRNAGWYFSNDQAFDIAVASQLQASAPTKDQRAAFLEALVSNMNYEGGCNPVNVTYLTGLGLKRQQEVVHQYAQNDRRILPPTGIPIGNIQAGFMFLDNYKKELGALSFPPDGAETQPYPFYDRWGDSFNVMTEFVVPDLGRGLATLACLMAQTPLKSQAWKPTPELQITGIPAIPLVGESFAVRAVHPNLDVSKALLVWEARDRQPGIGATLAVKARTSGDYWIELEAQWPDGRRAVAVTNWTAHPRSAQASRH